MHPCYSLHLPHPLFTFNWRIITLYYCVGFCHMFTWISHRSPPSWTSLPSSTPSHSSRLSQSTRLNSHHTANSHWLSTSSSWYFVRGVLFSLWMLCVNNCHTAVTAAFISVHSVLSLSHVWLFGPMDCSTPGFPVHHQLPELAQTHVCPVSDAIQLSHPLLSLLPSVFPRIRVFSKGSVLCIRWPKYQSFSFSINLRVFRTDFL